MELTSPAFTNGNPIPHIHTCKGNGTSPPLTISGVPEGTRSLALLVHDPDAPRGDFIHWTIWNIPPDTTAIAKGQPPAGAIQGLNDFGKTGFGAPCPPSGTHRYYFELYALDTVPALTDGSPIAELAAILDKQTLAKTILMGTVSAT